MKSPIIPFKFLDKYKYAYFVISSLLMAFFACIIAELLLGNDLSIKYIARYTLYTWGFMYPAAFVSYEAARKANNKL